MQNPQIDTYSRMSPADIEVNYKSRLEQMRKGDFDNHGETRYMRERFGFDLADFNNAMLTGATLKYGRLCEHVGQGHIAYARIADHHARNFELSLVHLEDALEIGVPKAFELAVSNVGKGLSSQRDLAISLAHTYGFSLKSIYGDGYEDNHIRIIKPYSPRDREALLTLENL
jgi:hypothetical protein